MNKSNKKLYRYMVVTALVVVIIISVLAVLFPPITNIENQILGNTNMNTNINIQQVKTESNILIQELDDQAVPSKVEEPIQSSTEESNEDIPAAATTEHSPTGVQVGGKDLFESESPPTSGEVKGQDLNTKRIIDDENSKPLAGSESENEDEDRISLLHVGPHKTGTTSLQTFMLLNKESKAALVKDNYKVPLFKLGPLYNLHNWSKNHAVLGYCLRSLGNERDTRCPTEAVQDGTLKYYRSFVNEAARSGSNIILSTEALDFDDLDIAGLISPLVPHFKVHIVLYYRRFYDWIHSLHNQHTKGGFNKDKTFVEWLSRDWLEISQHRYSAATYERYKNFVGVYNVSVVNMHEDPNNFNTNVRFFCQHLDNAPRACEVAKSTTVSQSNGSVDVNWLLFKSHIPLHHSIRLSDDKLKKIKNKFYEMNNVPKLCLSTELKDELLSVSLEAEVLLTPEWWHSSKEGLEDLKSDFAEKINSVLCSIDTEAILTSDEWQTFLTQLY